MNCHIEPANIPAAVIMLRYRKTPSSLEGRWPSCFEAFVQHASTGRHKHSRTHACRRETISECLLSLLVLSGMNILKPKLAIENTRHSPVWITLSNLLPPPSMTVPKQMLAVEIQQKFLMAIEVQSASITRYWKWNANLRLECLFIPQKVSPCMGILQALHATERGRQPRLGSFV